jgi:sulfur carrier protein ThiS
MSIRVRLSFLLMKYVPGYDPDTGMLLDGAEDETAAEIIERLGIPPVEVVTIMVNAYPARPESVVKDGDSVTLTKIIGGG